MRVILRPVGRNSWSGLIKYKNCYEDIGPYWTRSGRIYTGLTLDDEKRLGDLLGLDLRVASDFWKDFHIRTSGKDMYLDLDDPMDELRYLFLKNHKRVKQSLMENKATANFVLINKDEEAKRANVYNKARRDAFKEFDKLSPEEIRKCLRLYGHNGDTMSNEVAENRLFEIVEGNPQSFLDRWVNNTHRETNVLIERAIALNIIRKNKNIYQYGSDVIGHTLVETTDFLENPKNQDIRIVIMKAVESKQYMQAPPVEKIIDDTPVDESPIAKEKMKTGYDPLGEEDKGKARAVKRNKEDTI